MILSSILKWDWLLARLASILSAYGPSYIHWANHTTDRRVVAPHDYLRMLSGRCSARCNAVLARKETAWPAPRRDRPTELHGPSKEAAIRRLRSVSQLEQGVSEEGRPLSSVRNNSCRASAGLDASHRPPSVAWDMPKSAVFPMCMPCRKVGPSPGPSRPKWPA